MKRLLPHFFVLAILCMHSLLVSAQEGAKIDPLTSSDTSSSKALPVGMELVWNDEFNGASLDTIKWWNRYFSSLDWFNAAALNAFQKREIPACDYQMTGSSIVLKATDKIYPGSDRQISSIQTYNWERDHDFVNNIVGGYYEARIRRDYGKEGDRVNLAFWFDSPGPDLKYYLERGSLVEGVEGVRPRGQVFEIDLCEYITTEIVLHGNVDANGKFERNIGHYIHKGSFKGEWVVHSMLWSPAGLKFFIDGELVHQWWDKHDIKSPNHAMNLFLGAYGLNGTSMEVDYVRCYQWDLEKGNLMPNPGFEYSDTLFPWEGTALVGKEGARSGTQTLTVPPGAFVEQYLYLDHSSDYQLSFWSKGDGELNVTVEDLLPVKGIAETQKKLVVKGGGTGYIQSDILFGTLPEAAHNKRTVKVVFENKGSSDVVVDDVRLGLASN
ncbi:MAG: glycoside hydrolase family 16 protein [Breznakibacter sp.]|nr:glycoside hydrolase family 16 protein [Breznakibacter sp.]